MKVFSRSLPFLALMFVATAIGTAADPVPDVIDLPPAPAPAPPPPPAPGASQKLTDGFAYDIRCKVDCVVRAYPSNLVTINKEVVPAGESLRVQDNFVDGVKTRTYKGPMTVYTVKSVGTGPVEVVVTPVGFKNEKEIKTIALDVSNNKGPQPPPDVDPKPKPTPVVASWVVVVEESAARTPQIAAVVGDLAMWGRIQAKGLSWRVYDVDSSDAKAKKYDVIAKEVGLPAVICLDKSGNVVKKVKLPATAAEMEALATGGK